MCASPSSRVDASPSGTATPGIFSSGTRAQGISLTELARRSRISKGYLNPLENNPRGPRPSAEVLYRIAFALGTSLGTLLEKQVGSLQDELTDIPQGLRNLALAENLSEEEVRMLAQITYRGHRIDWLLKIKIYTADKIL